MSETLAVETVPVRDQVLRKLRDAILSGRFQPGQRLRERELVSLMGVSRTPIREALRKLELEGLVTAAPYRGQVVTLPTLEGARQLYEARAALEGQAVTLFTQRADGAAVARLKSYIANAKRALTRKHSAGVLAANNAFHDELATGCGNVLLQSMIANLRDRTVLLRVESLSNPGRPPRSISEHRAIVRMIERKDPEGARAVTERHIMHAWQAAQKQLRAGRMR